MYRIHRVLRATGSRANPSKWARTSNEQLKSSTLLLRTIDRWQTVSSRSPFQVDVFILAVVRNRDTVEAGYHDNNVHPKQVHIQVFGFHVVNKSCVVAPNIILVFIPAPAGRKSSPEILYASIVVAVIFSLACGIGECGCGKGEAASSNTMTLLFILPVE